MRRLRLAVAGIAALLALNAALFLVQPGLALPGSLGAYFFGSHLVRAEVLLKEDGVVHDYRIDSGRVQAAGAGSITLLERDRSLVTLRVAPTAEIQLNGRPAGLQALRRGMRALTIREDDGPATTIRVTGR